MTELAAATLLSRRGLLKGGGALVIGFSLAGPAFANAAAASAGPPNPKRIDSWIAIHADNTATLFIGKAELGQGNTTALLQIAGEELGLEMPQLAAAPLDTAVTPNQGATVSSSSVERGGPQIRAAAAEARLALLTLAAARLGAPRDRLTVSKGIVSVQGQPGRSVGYGALLGDKPFAIAFTGTAPLKPVQDYTLVGARIPRVDIPDKMRGRYRYMVNHRLPGMLHGRVVRPRGQGAYGGGAKPMAVDAASIQAIPDARIIRKGDFIGVVAPREWDAVQAAAALKVEWQMPETLPDSDHIFDKLLAAKPVDTVFVATGDTSTALGQAAHVVSSRFYGPYQSHAPFGPACALADVTPESGQIWCSTQDIYGTRQEIAALLGLAADRVRVRYVGGGGTFGHSCYDDAAQAAAILSQAAGKPVRVQFMRWDEHGWDNYGPAHVAEVSAGIDAAGKIVAYEYHGWQHGWMTVESAQELALGGPVEVLLHGSPSLSVNANNAGSMYDTPNRRIVNHQVPGLDGYLKGSFLRSPLDLSISFASEQTIDALARAAGIDPYLFRRRNIRDPRWLGVLDAVAQAVRWTARAAAPPVAGYVTAGRGIALGTHHDSYGAAVAEVEVDRKTGDIRVLQLFGALDAGLAVNPAIVESQITGMQVQATSRMLKEEVRFNRRNVTSLDWESYPILRFVECPKVTPIVVQRRDAKSTGAGEEVLAATGAAIANAVCDATGLRLQRYPLTPDRVRAALAAQGKG